ncbi:MAG: hypothetical protein IT455_05670 [Planctomycetes bacterium]|nr:hypothetical protein [Planctomycetota bacterium]
MIPHPLVLAVLGCDLGALLLLLYAGWVAARVVANWQADATPEQLRLERQTEAAGLAGSAAALLSLLGSLVLVVAFAGALPGLVPGAMCGTGVLQATGGRGERALALRLLALLLLGAWRLVARLDARTPRAPLVRTAARLLLLAVPIALLAGLDTWRALAALDVHTPVDCCAVVYRHVHEAAAAGTQEPATPRAAPWIVASPLAALVLGVAALAVLGRGGERSARRTGLLALAALTFAPIATLALVRVWSAYHYGVLQHHCPWCLLLATHHLVGYPLFFAIMLVLFEGPAAWLAQRLGERHAELAAAAAARTRRATWGTLFGLALYVALAFGPALLWRWRYGVWLHG